MIHVTVKQEINNEHIDDNILTFKPLAILRHSNAHEFVARRLIG